MLELKPEDHDKLEQAVARLTDINPRTPQALWDKFKSNPTLMIADLLRVSGLCLDLLEQTGRQLREQEAQRVSDEKLVDDAFFEAVGFTRPILGSWVIESEHHRVRVIQGMLQLEQKKFQGMQSEKSVILGEVETTKRGMLLKLLDSLLIPHK